MGGPASVTDSSADSCSFTFANFTSIVVSTSNESDLSGVQFLFGSAGKQLTIGNLPAISGVIIGQPAIYVQGNGVQLEVIGVLTGSDDATVNKLVQIATIAVGRWQQ